MKIKILYLEDEPLFWEMFMTVCSNEYRSVICASRVSECVEILKNNHRIDLIVSDYQLQNDTCETLLSYLKSNHLSIPVIIYSSQSEETLRTFIQYEDLITIIEKPDILCLSECINTFEQMFTNCSILP